MRKTKEFMLFGFAYRMTQLSAARAFDRLLSDEESEDILPLLATASIDGVVLDNKKAINELVKDKMDIMQPRMVLNSLAQIINEFNFGFIGRRKEARIPSYLRSYAESESKNHSVESPILGLLIAESKATLRELEEYYSLEDAFRLYDIIFLNKLNQAEAQHAATKRR
jgi:hypothetical protein